MAGIVLADEDKITRYFTDDKTEDNETNCPIIQGGDRIWNQVIRES